MLKANKYDDRLLAPVPILGWKLNLDSGTDLKEMPEIWSGNGKTPVILVHTGWKNNADDKYLGIKGGSAHESHGHMDAGSFVYDAYGVRWSHDPGKEGYADLEKSMAEIGGDLWEGTQSSLKWDIFRNNNIAHSTLSVYPQNYYEVTSDKYASDPKYSGYVHISDHVYKGRAQIMEVYSGHDRLGGKLDMTPILSNHLESATRSVCLEGEKLVVTDVLTTRADEPVVVEWRMFKALKVTAKATDSCVELSNGDILLKLKADTGGYPVTYRDFGGNRPSYWTPRSWDTQNKGSVVGYHVTIPGGVTATLVTTLAK